MNLTTDDIKNINLKCPYNQGVFTEPYGIPVHIKEPVIYMRWETGGVSGGSCWESSDPQYYECDEKPDFEVLKLVFEKLDIRLTYNDIILHRLLHTNNETDYEYYGNSTDYGIEYIILSELISIYRDNKINSLLE